MQGNKTGSTVQVGSPGIIYGRLVHRISQSNALLFVPSNINTKKSTVYIRQQKTKQHETIQHQS